MIKLSNKFIEQKKIAKNKVQNFIDIFEFEI